LKDIEDFNLEYTSREEKGEVASSWHIAGALAMDMCDESRAFDWGQHKSLQLLLPPKPKS
jgi:hypothetical protein